MLNQVNKSYGLGIQRIYLRIADEIPVTGGTFEAVDEPCQAFKSLARKVSKDNKAASIIARVLV